jgi:putative heme degradation protein
MGLVYLFNGKMKRRGKKVLTLEKLELEKKKIFQTIYGLKKHAGSQESEEYRKLMEEYSNRAIQISYEIYNLKNKI